MKIVERLPEPVRELEHIEIEMSDGCRLAARIWMPEDARTRPVPAILEYIPYRKNDLTASRDAMMHPYVAGHGYAVVRVDLRGAGESEGVLSDEYLQQELDDGVEAIQWIADQPWCDGNVGMIGISWGGFNGLQIAAMQPPALKAIITCCSTDDRYADDVHYMGGCLLIDNLSWASIMFGRNTCPPDPRHVGERWRDIWMERLKGSGLWLEAWLEHQVRDDYWRHGSVCEHIERIKCPVYAVSGWADGYCNAVFRLMDSLEVPRKGLVGPWAHKYPHIGVPGPAIGFLQECLRWWDHWLKGRDTGIMDEPPLRVWMQDSAPPRTWYAERPGRWVTEPSWPSPGIEPEVLALEPGNRLAAGSGASKSEALQINSPLEIGLHGGKWCSYAEPGDQPADQRPDDAGSLIFETAPLEEPLEILGAPVALLEIESDKPVAQVAVRLNDVAEDGEATRVSYGLLNLTHRDGHAEPKPLEPGKRTRIRVQLKHIAQRFPAGHKVRLAISTSYWPLAWPPPEPVTLTVHTGSSRLELPKRPLRKDELPPSHFPAPEAAQPLETTLVKKPAYHWRVIRDLSNDEHTLEITDGGGVMRIERNGLHVGKEGSERYAYCGDDFRTLTGETRWIITFSRDEWQVKTVTETRLTSDETAFHVEAWFHAFEGDRMVFEERWQRAIPRNLV